MALSEMPADDDVLVVSGDIAERKTADCATREQNRQSLAVEG